MEGSVFKEIAYDCKKATFLTEKKLIGKIGMAEKLVLKIHLTGCSACRIFEQQSLMINTLVHDLFEEPEAIKLDNEFKNNILEQIIERLEKY
jgi:predicted anti-sigma-YlaC factor YlaD